MTINKTEFEVARHRAHLTTKDIANALEITGASYCRKVNSKRPFTSDEIVKLSEIMHLDCFMVGIIFFDGKLPKCNGCDRTVI